MESRQRIGLLVLLLVAAGCHTTPKTPPVSVRVIDAETKAPVAGASVRLWRPDPRGPNLGSDSQATTAADGTAQVRSTAPPDIGVVVGVIAAGYLPEEADFRAGQGLPGTATTPASPTVVEVFTGPRPVVELVVPTNYRGLVKVEVLVQEGPVTPGQRQFRFPVSPTGTVQVVGPPVLKHGSGATFQAKYADGSPLAVSPEGLQVGFRWLRCEGARSTTWSARKRTGTTRTGRSTGNSPRHTAAVRRVAEVAGGAATDGAVVGEAVRTDRDGCCHVRGGRLL